MGSEVIDKQISLLNCKNELVTFWAAVGLFSQSDHLKSHSHELILSLEKLTYPPAKIFLAGALLNVTNEKSAREIIEESLLSNDVYLNCLSMQILLNIELDKAKSFLPVVHTSIGKYKGVKDRGGVNDYMHVVLLRLENKPFTFEHYW